MKTLRASLLLAGLLLLSATTLQAQGRIACKDGSPPKIGHFTCWGHGGVVSAPLKKARAAETKPAVTKPAAHKPTAKKLTKKPAKKPAAKKKKSTTKARPKHSAK
jgi:hypothetical protein